jgi:hypothetical protein
VNRPHPGLDIRSIIEGLAAFRREYKGEYHLEVLLVSGVNDAPEELSRIRKVVDLIDPDRIELNTVARPPAETYIRGLSEAEMQCASEIFPMGKVQIIGTYKGSGCTGESHCLDLRMLDLVRRRPCTLREMAASLGVSPSEAEGALLRLEGENRVTRTLFNDLEYISPSH